MDRDYDGRLSLEEFMGEETPVEKLFKLMDKNGDGFVTKKVKTSQNYKRNFFIFQNFCIIARLLLLMHINLFYCLANNIM